jgi:phosphoglucosamine mutase
VLQSQVVAHGAHLGIALDGDADRLQMVDEHGTIIDGDQVMGLIARSWHEAGRLTGGRVAATVMSNLGLERYLDGFGVGLLRTAVGDRYVLEAMRAHGCNLGGEQSGHIILTDYATTGDGLVAALQVLAVIAGAGKPASEALRVFAPLPQILKNVRFANGGTPLDAPSVKAAIAAAEKRLVGCGRILVRKSGTEPLVRVMAEGEDAALVATVVDDVAAAIAAASRG